MDNFGGPNIVCNKEIPLTFLHFLLCIKLMLYHLILCFLFLVYDVVFAYITTACMDKGFSQNQNVPIDKPIKRSIAGKINKVNVACLL